MRGASRASRHRLAATRLNMTALAAVLLAAGCGSSSSGSSPSSRTPTSVAGPAHGAAPNVAPPADYTAWPEAERSVRHSSQATAKGPQSVHLRWKAALGAATTEGPSVGSDGTIYESTDRGVLHAIDPRTGKDRWTYDGQGPIGGDLSTTAAVLPDGRIAWPGPRHTLFGLSPSGHVLWTVALGGVPLSPVVAGGGTLYVMTTSGELSAVQVSASSAAPRWTIKLGKTSFGSPAIGPDGTVLTTVDNSLVKVRDNGGSGKQLWRFSVAKQVEVSPAVSPTGVTILGTDDGFEYGVSAVGKQLWKHPINTFSYSSPAVADDGTAYFGDNKGALTVVDSSNGTVARTVNATPGAATPGNIWTAPLIDSAGDVYYGTNDGHVYGFAATGSMLFDLSTGKTVASYPALTSDGGLLIGSDDGYLYDIGQ